MLHKVLSVVSSGGPSGSTGAALPSHPLPKEPMHPEESSWTPSPRDREQPPAQTRRILRLFRPYRGRLAIVGLLVAASSLVSVASPFLLREILDVAIPQGRTG